ncbi:type III PLP-dependent enzyme [Streptomyces tubbatahanensis]|uniref:Type III PLP-dependent enzyme n=1 Tax=Streptomyces tubbatahanensis TaxID=2923272 RepID=A0ABY3XKV0_9ACTN|nr:type III PLP-dependent enzyme [Streptomyces tubbatahanensis]UNS95028.1 type III PLP-dependent enzyme [Streptomyces tubbatahanensis]
MKSLTHLAETFGTPLYVYRLDKVRRAALDLLDALPHGARLYYSLKANPHPAVVRELSGLGLHMEISSPGELAVSEHAGHPARHCLYTGPGKTPAEVSGALAAGVRLFSVESPTDLRRIAELGVGSGATVDYLVRLNARAAAAGTGLRMTGRSSQFGTDPDAALAAGMFDSAPGARAAGAHLFSATNVADEQDLVEEFDSVLHTALSTFGTAGVAPSLLDLGGGFAAPFAAPGERPAYTGLRAVLEERLDARVPRWRAGEPGIAFESGRYLAADCGSLLTTVLDVKHSRGTTYVVLDAGVNVLGGMSGVGRLLTPAVQPSAEADGAAGDTGRAEVTLVGPLCTPLDVLARSARIPVPRPGDVLRIDNTGAYGLSASLSGFLSRPPATEVVLGADDVVLDVRALETVYSAGAASGR